MPDPTRTLTVTAASTPASHSAVGGSVLSTGLCVTGPPVAASLDGSGADDNEKPKALLIKVWPAHVGHLDQCKAFAVVQL